MNIKNDNQESLFDYKAIDFKDVDLQTYTLKINSKDRDLKKEPNPFSFEIVFNQEKSNSTKKAIIFSKFKNIKKISLSQIIIPRYIPRDYIGEPFTGITPLYNTSNSISLSYYPGININNTVIPITDGNGVESKIEVVELVDISLKKLYLVALQYNNPYYTTRYINIKAELFSYLNINGTVYPISSINGNIITLENTTNYPLPIYTNQRLIVADFYKNVLMVDMNGTKIGINESSINVVGGNILNFQYLFKDQFLEYQINSSVQNILERKLFKVTNLTKQLYNPSLPDTVENTIIIISGVWVGGIPSTFNYTPLFFDNVNTIRLNLFNYGIKDLFEERMFYLNLNPFVPSRCLSTDQTINNTFGVLFASTPNSTKDYLYLKGDAIETYTNVNLQTTNNKIEFSLMDSNNDLIGNIYNKYFNLYQPNGISLQSYLQFSPDINIILKIEEYERKFNNFG